MLEEEEEEKENGLNVGDLCEFWFDGKVRNQYQGMVIITYKIHWNLYNVYELEHCRYYNHAMFNELFKL